MMRILASTALATLALTLMLTSCNKVKSTSKKLNGEWDVSSWVVNGVETTSDSLTFYVEFQSESLSNEDERGDGRMAPTIPGTISVATPFEYTVSEDGKMLSITMNQENSTYTLTWDGKKNVTLDGSDQSGDTHVLQMTKR